VTLDSHRPVAQAVAVGGGRVLALVGPRAAELPADAWVRLTLVAGERVWPA